VQYTTAPATTNIPTFADTVGRNPGQYDELRTYVNDAGQTLRIPFKNGQPIYPIPYGYKYQAEETTKPTDTSTVPTTVVRPDDDGGGDGADREVDTGTSISGYPGRTGLEGLQAGLRGITDYGSYDLSTPASENPYGVTGSSGFNLGAMLGVLTGNPLSALASVSGIREPTMVGAYGPTAGFPGTLDRSTLDAIATGKGTLGPLDARQQGFSITQEQARAAVRASNVAGVESISGRYGYNPGDAIPGVKDGFMHATGIGVNVRTGKLTGHYKDIASFVDRMSMTREEKAKFDRELASEISVANMKSMDFSRTKAGIDAAKERADARAKEETDAAAEAAMTRDMTEAEAQEMDESIGDTMSDMAEAEAQEADEASGADGENGSSGGAASGGCFEKGTLFKMADGTTKCIEDIKPGDKMYKGGLVYAVMQGDGLLEDWYNYNGVHVTSGHPVLDNGTWKRVGETESKKAIDKREIYYSLMNSDHLMISENGTEFTDFVEIGADIGGRSEWMMEMLNQKKAA
jgi:hypothetical protein